LAELNGIEVALAGPADLAAVQSFYLRVGYSGGANPNDRIIIATQAGSIVAAAKLSSEVTTLVLRGMYVAESLRGTGVGTLLLGRISAEIGMLACWCIPYTHLEGFYSRIGFRICDNGEIPGFLVTRKKQYISAGHDVSIMKRSEGWNLPPE